MDIIIIILIIVALIYYLNYKEEKEQKEQKEQNFENNNKYKKLYILGDLHGDLENTKKALRKAGLIDENNKWIKEECILIQMGDQVDAVCRKASKCKNLPNLDVEVVYFMEEMAKQALLKKSKVVSILGNHEIMNVQGDLRFVSDNDIERIGGEDERKRLFQPGSDLCKLLSERPLIYKFNNYIFCHGGLSMSMLKNNSITEMNQQTKEWLFNKREIPEFLEKEDSPIWSRKFAFDMGSQSELDEILKTTNSEKLFVGHSVVDNIQSKYNNKFWLTDVGISSTFPGNKIQLVEVKLDDNTINILL